MESQIPCLSLFLLQSLCIVCICFTTPTGILSYIWISSSKHILSHYFLNICLSNVITACTCFSVYITVLSTVLVRDTLLFDKHKWTLLTGSNRTLIFHYHNCVQQNTVNRPTLFGKYYKSTCQLQSDITCSTWNGKGK